MAGVEALPALVGRKQADAHVHPPVAHREDPAVAGHHVALGVADVEVRLNEGVVVAVRAVVAAQRHAHGELTAPGRAQHAADPRVGAVGHHDVAGLDGPGARGALLLDGHADEGGQRARRRGRLVDHRACDLGALEQGRPRRLGVPGHQAVQVVTGDGVAVVGKVGVLRPLHVDGAAEAEGPQAAVAVGPGQGPLQVHVGQLPDGPRREAVAAGLLPGELLLLHDDHVPAGLGQPVGARGAGGPRSDDHHVVDVLRGRPCRCRGRCGGGCRGRSRPAWRPGGLPRRIGCGGGCRLLGGRLARRRLLGRRLLLGRSFRRPRRLLGGAGPGGLVGSRHEGIVGPPPGPLTSGADVPGKAVTW